IDARLHAVVADAMTCSGAQGIVDHHDRQRAKGVTPGSREVHRRYPLFQRTAEKLRAERILLVDAGFPIAKALGTTVLALVVAPDAVIGVIERLLERRSGIGQPKPVPDPLLSLGPRVT